MVDTEDVTIGNECEHGHPSPSVRAALSRDHRRHGNFSVAGEFIGSLEILRCGRCNSRSGSDAVQAAELVQLRSRLPALGENRKNSASSKRETKGHMNTVC